MPGSTLFILLALAVYTVWAAVLSRDDWRSHRLPNVKVAWMSVSLLACLSLASAAGHNNAGWLPLAAGFGYLTWTALLRAVSGGAVGGGDVKLAFPVGIMSGWLGEWTTGSVWGGLAWAVGAAYLIGALSALAVLAWKRNLRGWLAFGPMMLAGGYAPLLAQAGV